MPIIDADTHVDETEATWEYLREFEQEFIGRCALCATITTPVPP